MTKEMYTLKFLPDLQSVQALRRIKQPRLVLRRNTLKRPVTKRNREKEVSCGAVKYMQTNNL